MGDFEDYSGLKRENGDILSFFDVIQPESGRDAAVFRGIFLVRTAFWAVEDYGESGYKKKYQKKKNT